MSEQGLINPPEAASPPSVAEPLPGLDDAFLSEAGPPVVFIALAVGFIAALTFSAFPDIDLFVAKLFYAGGGQFLAVPGGLVEGLRFIIRKLFLLAALGVAAGFVLSAFTSFRLIDFGFARWTFLGLALLAGPFLVVNDAKDFWGRARPNQIQEFGGSRTFSPPLARSGECRGDCSFVSQEVANTFTIVLAPAFLLAGRRRREVMGAAVAAGAVTGLLRMMAGGHFLSDVAFAMVFCTLTTWFAWSLVFRWRPEWFADEGPIRSRILIFGRRARNEGPEVYQKLRSRLSKQEPAEKQERES